MKSTEQGLPNGMEGLAQHYADELSAQFRTLNMFVQHAGEIGRAHETFLRAILTRFLPASFRCGSGFIASKEGVTSQQDIIIFEQTRWPILFEVGDCLVADGDAVRATVEVKTSLDSRARFMEAVQKLAAQRAQRRGRGFTGLYAWDGIAEVEAIECLWDYFRSLDHLDMSNVPDAIFVRGRYLVLRNDDGRLDTAPLLVMRLDSRDREGAALLSFVTRMWACSIGGEVPWPWWMDDWRSREGDLLEHFDWPDDLTIRVEEHLRRLQG